MNIKKGSQVIIRAKVLSVGEETDFWVNLRLKESGIILELPLKDVFYCQRQDSLIEQLKDVIDVANKIGCYDAADFIESSMEKK